MSKGRNTSKVSLRLPDWAIEKLKQRCGTLSLAQYIQGQIVKSLSAPTTNQPTPPTKATSYSASTTPEVPQRPQLYDPSVHKAGDRVLVRDFKGRRLVEAVVPDLDADGHPMPF